MPGPKRYQKPRVLLSCNACRRDKLKCDRGQPCLSCVRRNRHSLCVYIAERSVRRHTPDGHSTTIESNQQSASPEANYQRPGERSHVISRANNPSPAHHVKASVAVSVHDVPRSVPDGAVFIDPNHWRSIGLSATRHLHDGKAQSQDEVAPDRQPGRSSRPLLFSALCSETTFTERLGVLPSRNEADFLLDRFLESVQPATIGVHSPTFKEEYTQFWERPQAASPGWISLFYGILACGIYLEHSTDSNFVNSEIPGDFLKYLTQCAAFLALSDFTIPGPYKVDAATIYLEMEYVRVDVLKTDLSILLGLISRQAILAGYHRNPDGHPGISVFEAEMRRRTWLVLVVTDCTVAYETGLPPVIPHGVHKVGYPRNLLDEDICPSMSALPSERSATIDCNRITYMIKLDLILSVAADIPGSATEPARLVDATEKLKEKLEGIWRSVPSVLRFPRKTTPTLVDKMTIWRSNLEVTYHRTRCVLHRPFLCQRSLDPETTRRRDTCVQSALRIIQIANDVFPVLLQKVPNRHRVWFCASRCVTDGLTAAMVLCLELTYRAKDAQPTPLSAAASFEELESSLKDLERTWYWAQKLSPLVERSINVLTAILRRLGISALQLNEEPFAHDTHSRVGNNLGSSCSTTKQWTATESTDDFIVPRGPIQELIDRDYLADIFDWDLWDHGMHVLDNPMH